MTNALEEVLDDVQLRQQLSQAGLATARRYALTRVAPLFERTLVQAVA